MLVRYTLIDSTYVPSIVTFVKYEGSVPWHHNTTLDRTSLAHTVNNNNKTKEKKKCKTCTKSCTIKSFTKS